MVEIIGTLHEFSAKEHKILRRRLNQLPPRSRVALELSPAEAAAIETYTLLRMLYQKGYQDEDRIKEAKKAIEGIRIERFSPLSLDPEGKRISHYALADEAERCLEEKRDPDSTLMEVVRPITYNNYFGKLGRQLVEKGHSIVGIDQAQVREKISKKITAAQWKKLLHLTRQDSAASRKIRAYGEERSHFKRSREMARLIAADDKITHALMGDKHARDIEKVFASKIKTAHERQPIFTHLYPA